MTHAMGMRMYPSGRRLHLLLLLLVAILLVGVGGLEQRGPAAAAAGATPGAPGAPSHSSLSRAAGKAGAGSAGGGDWQLPSSSPILVAGRGGSRRPEARGQVLRSPAAEAAAPASAAFPTFVGFLYFLAGAFSVPVLPKIVNELVSGGEITKRGVTIYGSLQSIDAL